MENEQVDVLNVVPYPKDISPENDGGVLKSIKKEGTGVLHY